LGFLLEINLKRKPVLATANAVVAVCLPTIESVPMQHGCESVR
jgi:hypothetical protein